MISVSRLAVSARAVAATLLLLSGAAPAAKPAPPPAPRDFVTDGAGVLSAATRAMLEERLRAFEAETSNQFLVWIAPRVPEGTTLEEFTVEAAQAWGAGQKQRKNGIVLFVFPEDRAARFEVGYGLEGAFPDALASRVLGEQAIPRFRSGDWNGGVAAAVDGAIAATKGEYKGTGRRPAPGARRERFPWGLVFFVLIFVVLPRLGGRRRGFFWWGGGGGGWGGGGGSWGGGGFSGGGGSFGGGGASGRW